MESYLATPDPTLALSTDGILVARSPALTVRDPAAGELQDALAAAFGRAMDVADLVAPSNAPAKLLRSSSSQHEQYEKVRHVFEKAPLFHEFSEFAFAVGDLFGWTLQHDPLLEQVKAIDGLLHGYFKEVDQKVFANWSATRLAQLADVQALASSARDTIRTIVVNDEDLTAPLTVAMLGHAHRDSLTAVNTFTAAVESGYWLRPYSDAAINLGSWGTKIDDRARVNPDGTVWDPRIALPTLLYALAVRIVVLKAIYNNSRKYCQEINDRVSFLLQVQMHWQTGIRRKERLSTPEFKIGAGFSVRPFAAGAVDVFTGNHDLIDVDADALNLYYALGLWGGPLPAHVSPIPPELVAPNITANDIDLRFNDEYRAILSKQAAVAFTRLRWSTGLQGFSDTIKALGEICAPRPADDVIGRYREGLPLVRESGGLRVAGGLDDIPERVELARALARILHPRGGRSSGQAMADRFAVLGWLSQDDGALISELREVVERHVRRGRPWERRDDAGSPVEPQQVDPRRPRKGAPARS
jgi:hypothetical protein